MCKHAEYRQGGISEAKLVLNQNQFNYSLAYCAIYGLSSSAPFLFTFAKFSAYYNSSRTWSKKKGKKNLIENMAIYESCLS